MPLPRRNITPALKIWRSRRGLPSPISLQHSCCAPVANTEASPEYMVLTGPNRPINAIACVPKNRPANKLSMKALAEITTQLRIKTGRSRQYSRETSPSLVVIVFIHFMFLFFLTLMFALYRQNVLWFYYSNTYDN